LRLSLEKKSGRLRLRSALVFGLSAHGLLNAR
jgi:hypothetical protein